MTTRLLMTADAVGGVWEYATELAAALVPLGYETTIAVLGPAPSEAQLAELHPTASATPARAGVQSRHAGEHGRGPADVPSPDPGLRRGGGEGRGGVRVIPTDLPLDWLAPGPGPVLAAGRAIADLARQLRTDIVHLNSPTLAAARFDQPVVAVAHGCVATWWRAAHGCDPDPAYRWQADLQRRGLLAADAAVAPSASFARDLQRTYALPSAPLAIHNGRSPFPLRGEGADPGLEPEEAGEGQYDSLTAEPAPYALTAGRLWDRVKNTAVLDRAAARLAAPLRAAGPVAGPHGEAVAPEHLHLLGTLSDADLAAELARRPVFVSAATFEPFGFAVLEAAQAGCALVLSDIPTFRELWEDAALFVPADDDAAVADAIEGLLSDPARRAELGRSAAARAARYTPEASAAAYVALYARLLSTRRAAA